MNCENYSAHGKRYDVRCNVVFNHMIACHPAAFTCQGNQGSVPKHRELPTQDTNLILVRNSLDLVTKLKCVSPTGALRFSPSSVVPVDLTVCFLMKGQQYIIYTYTSCFKDSHIPTKGNTLRHTNTLDHTHTHTHTHKHTNQGQKKQKSLLL